MILAASFQPLRKALERVTSGFLYKNAYDTDELLYMLSQVMSSSLTLKVLAENVMEMLRAKAHITKIEIYVLNQKGENVLQTVPIGQPPYALDNEEIKVLGTSEKPLVFSEMTEGPQKAIMRRKEIEVFLKLKTTHRLVGFLIMGPKITGDIYFDQDIKTLTIMSPSFAVAVENSLSYEEIRKFNDTLQLEIKKATEDLLMANERLKEVDKLKDEFISIASHDLRTPLTTVKNYLWLTLNKGKLVPKVKQDLERAYSAADRTALLVADMLDVSRIEGNRIELKMEPLKLNDLLTEVSDEIAAKAQAKKVDFTIKCDKEAKIVTDHERLLQVIINLADNAVKFTQENGKVAINVKIKDDKVLISISDTGMGIAKEDFPKLFTKFGRLHNTLSSVPEVPGTGLGLYIAKKMVDLLRGTIDVSSMVGKGTTFTCSFVKA
ncbi:HAMP domain-containing histidine kinase [Candidatus Microgenomates bacterium]|nr:HAMP domain-containing histidine kinase [Candidatus Microgenomates bacterium]